MEANDLRQKALAGHRPGQLDSPLGPGAHLPDGRAAPGLVHLPPAVLGRAHRGLSLPGLRRGFPYPGDYRAHHRSWCAPKGRISGSTPRRRTCCPPGTTCAVRRPDFEKETDILDVWFDSGVSWAAVVEARPGPGSPADLYLEGSDQHRGWFHSSLLTCVGTRGQAPLKERADPRLRGGRRRAQDVQVPGQRHRARGSDRKYGAEILRLWVAAEDYRDDIRLSAGDPEAAGGCLPAHPQHRPLPAGKPL